MRPIERHQTRQLAYDADVDRDGIRGFPIRSKTHARVAGYVNERSYTLSRLSFQVPKRIFMGSALLMITIAAGMVGSATSVAAASPLHGGLPIIRDSGAGEPTISTNWSGYAVTASSPFTYASTTFMQPSIKCTGQKYEDDSVWVGLDGFDNSTVEQDGTSADCTRASGYKSAKYQAWYEMYPGPSANVFDVAPGDTITASVTYDASENYDLTVTDTTSGATYTEVATCSTCARDSAEWIIERRGILLQRQVHKRSHSGTSRLRDDHDER